MAGSADLATNLRNAKGKASVIFLGRLVRLDPPPGNGVYTRDSEATAVFEVIERFKGQVGQQVSVASGNGFSCLVRFRGVGTTYLVYADGDALELSAWLCSRTRVVSEADPELTWLRTGELPLIPVAMRREYVECAEQCVLSDAARRLAGVKEGDSSCLACDAAQASALWKTRKPFYGSQQYEEHRTVMLGRAQDGRSFEVAEIAPSGDKCNRRLERRWCKDLLVSSGEEGPALHCTEPSQVEVLCDETRTRKAYWGPVEELNVKSCVWVTADEADCEEGLVPPKPRPAASSSTPILMCRPYRYFRKGDSFRCQVLATGVVGGVP